MRASFSLLRQGKFDARVVIFPALRYNSHVCKHAACAAGIRSDPMKFEEYLEGLRGKSVAVIGLGVSNRPLMELLLSHGMVEEVVLC